MNKEKFTARIYRGAYKDDKHFGKYSCFLCAWFVVRSHMLLTNDYDDWYGTIDEDFIDEDGDKNMCLISVVKKDSVFPMRRKVRE